MERNDLTAVLGEFFLTPLEQSVAGTSLSVCGLLETARSSQKVYLEFCEKRSVTPEEIFQEVPLTRAELAATYSFFNISQEHFGELNRELQTGISHSVFLWGRLQNTLENDEFILNDEGPLRPEYLSQWNQLLPGQFGMRGSMLVTEAQELRHELKTHLDSEQMPSVLKPTRVTSLLRSEYENRIFGCYSEALCIIRLFCYLYAAIAKWEDTLNAESSRARQLRIVEQGMHSTLDFALNVFPWVVFGHRFGFEYIHSTGEPMSSRAPYAGASLTSWEIIGSGPPKAQLKETRDYVKFLAPKVAAYIAGDI